MSSAIPTQPHESQPGGGMSIPVVGSPTALLSVLSCNRKVTLQLASQKPTSESMHPIPSFKVFLIPNSSIFPHRSWGNTGPTCPKDLPSQPGWPREEGRGVYSKHTEWQGIINGVCFLSGSPCVLSSLITSDGISAQERKWKHPCGLQYFQVPFQQGRRAHQGK